MEPSDNIEYICKDCSEKRTSAFQEAMRKDERGFIAKIQKGLASQKQICFKFEFNDGKSSEHMWMLVSSIDERSRTVSGTLDNEPIVVAHLKVGDFIVKSIYEIEDAI